MFLFCFLCNPLNALDIEESKNKSVVQENWTSTIKVIPNPSKLFTIINFENKEGTEYEIFVWDINGKVVHYIQNQKGERALLQCSRFGLGIYFFEFRKNSQRKYVGKLVID